LVTMVGTADLADPAEAHPVNPGADPADLADLEEAVSAAEALAAEALAAEAQAAAGNATGLGVDGRAQRQQPRRGPQVLLAETPGQHLLAEDTVELAPGGQNRDARVVKPVGESHQS
jgi:hypothetical protein